MRQHLALVAQPVEDRALFAAPRRSSGLLVLPLALAIVMVFVTWPHDRQTRLGPANLGLGAGPVSAAGPQTIANQRPLFVTPTVADSRPAANKGDGAPAPVSRSGDPFDVRGAPTVDAPTIKRILRSYGSPAVDAADAMYALGVQYGIDPAFCLAFFIHESTAGTAGVARVTKSVGNIRTTPGYRDYQGYRHYDSWEQGIDDWYQLISDLYIGAWGLTTVDAIIPVYAPSSDGNNPTGYVATVKKLVGGWRA